MPREATLHEIEGLPCCDSVATRTRPANACRCALSHGGYVDGNRDSILGIVFQTSRIAQCDNRRAFKCSRCASEFQDELRRGRDFESDGFLTVKRFIDLGPMEMATNPEQLSLQWLAPCSAEGSLKDPKHCLLGAEFNLRAEWRMVRTRTAFMRCLTWISRAILPLRRGADVQRNSRRY